MENKAPIRLGDLRNGALFVTQDGIMAVKSEYRYENMQPLCVLLASGEYAHFPNGEDELVSEIEVNYTKQTLVIRHTTFGEGDYYEYPDKHLDAASPDNATIVNCPKCFPEEYQNDTKQTCPELDNGKIPSKDEVEKQADKVAEEMYYQTNPILSNCHGTGKVEPQIRERLKDMKMMACAQCYHYEDEDCNQDKGTEAFCNYDIDRILSELSILDRERIARLVHKSNFDNGGELHSWELCKQDYYYSVADAILEKE